MRIQPIPDGDPVVFRQRECKSVSQWREKFRRNSAKWRSENVERWRALNRRYVAAFRERQRNAS